MGKINVRCSFIPSVGKGVGLQEGRTVSMLPLVDHVDSEEGMFLCSHGHESSRL